MARRNPPWQRDELILALDLYFRHRPDTIGKKHPEVAALSELLNKLPIHPDRPDTAKFRNVNGTYMKRIWLAPQITISVVPAPVAERYSSAAGAAGGALNSRKLECGP